MMPPTYALDLFMKNNVYPSRITATAGTRFVGINRKVQSLSSFSLRIYHLNVSSVLVDQVKVSFIA